MRRVFLVFAVSLGIVGTTSVARACVGGTPKPGALSVTNCPNPFNPSTTVSYTVPSRGHVEVAVFDVRGTRVITLVNEEKSAGSHVVAWNARTAGGMSVRSGVYLLRIEHGGATRTQKMVVLK